ncbi:hypothetical protein [Rubinisphaera italica]|uniref:Uncharacterized protein n=1 Tax=Rubinisphaera italica TaxID=2527969 RepID=A0A5C5XHD5_9PLAN|nr:hypothetical protein [Rubinisphaera italica]TWT61723.1 hypothetical protein Pan54_24600 [Rubinisphaera italica]
MSLREQSHYLNLLIERVGYNGEDGTVAITLRPTGLEEFLQQTINEEMSL